MKAAIDTGTSYILLDQGIEILSLIPILLSKFLRNLQQIPAVNSK